MTITLFDEFTTCSESRHYVGRAPSKAVLDNARKTLLSGVSYRQCGQLLTTQGPPNATRNGNRACDYYIIFPVIDPPGNDDKIVIGAYVDMWDEYNSTTLDVRWDTVLAAQYGVTNGNTQTNGSIPGGGTFFLNNEIAYNLNAVTSGAASYGYTLLELNNGIPAVVTAFTMPRKTVDYQADTPAASSFDVQFGLKNDAFNVGMPLLGCSSYNSNNGSAGALCQFQNSVDNTASLVASTSPCVFQWGHPSGLYHDGTGAFVRLFDTVTVNSTAYDVLQKTRGRRLIAGDKSLDLAVVARWNNASGNTQLKFTATNGSSATYTFPTGDQTTAVLKVSAALFQHDPDGDTIKIEVKADVGDAIEIKTLALFERSRGNTV